MNLAKVIRRAFDSLFKMKMERIHTVFPAQVVSYDPATNTCSIQPCISVFRSDDVDTGYSELPQLDDIPVGFAGSGNVFLTCPVKAGSYGVYHVAEDDINDWLSKGGIVAPSSVDRFNLDTGFFEPRAPWMFDSSFGAVSTDRFSIRTRDGATEVSVLENGNVEITTTGTVKVNGDSDAAALSSKVDDFISKIDDALRNWRPMGNDGGAALQAKYILNLPSPPDSVASEILKVEE